MAAFLLTFLLLMNAAAVFAQGDRSRVCAGCHREIWASYQRTGMGRSFTDKLEGAVPVLAAPFHHQASDSYFSMIQRGGEVFQRRHQLDTAGREVNVMEKRVDYVMGSGNHARTYLHRTPGGALMELPLGWYAEKGGYWAMNPGYDRADHDGFRRPVTYDCMFCHNAYPRVPARNEQMGADAIYPSGLPQGIDCERCHGGGARHAELAGRPGVARAAVRGAIVNPARLSADRQLEICMACHLETTSFPLPNAIQRYNRGPFSWRPGEALGAFLLNFDHAPEAGRQDKFEIVSAAYRMRKSACFLKSPGKMTCTTCHDPHAPASGDEAERRYVEACRQCHGGPLSAASHAGRNDCVECHMPKRRTEDVVHAVVTDHLIQRKRPVGDLLAERAERRDEYRGEVVLYYPESLAVGADAELYLAVAQVKQKSNLKPGIARLTAAIAKYRPQRAEWYFELAEALEHDGQLAKAVASYREAVKRDAAWPVAWQRLGTVLRRASRREEAVTALRRSLTLAPERALTWHELGLTFQSMGRRAEAVDALRKAIARDADFAEAHSNLGILLAAGGDGAAAERSFREAVRIQPNYADARGNLANVLASSGRRAEAVVEFESALKFRPADAGTRYNYALALGGLGRYEDAQRELEACLRADGKFTDAHELLGDLLLARNKAGEAASHFREAVAQRPASARANLGLGIALAAAGDRAGAMASLRKAAAGTDEEIRKRAMELLRQLGAEK